MTFVHRSNTLLRPEPAPAKPHVLADVGLRRPDLDPIPAAGVVVVVVRRWCWWSSEATVVVGRTSSAPAWWAAASVVGTGTLPRRYGHAHVPVVA